MRTSERTLQGVTVQEDYGGDDSRGGVCVRIHFLLDSRKPPPTTHDPTRMAGADVPACRQHRMFRRCGHAPGTVSTRDVGTGLIAARGPPMPPVL